MSSRSKFLWPVLWVAGGIALGLAFGREARPQAPATGDSESAACPPETTAVPFAVIRERAAVRDIPQPNCTDPEDDAAYRRQQAESLIARLTQRVALHADALTHAGLDRPETHVGAAAEFIEGWSQAFLATTPHLVGELGDEVRRRACAKGASDREVLLLSRVMVEVPESASEEAMHCLFDGRTEENAVLWGALDAWQAAKLPKNEALLALERSATDERTKWRLSGEPPSRALASAMPTDQADARPSVAHDPAFEAFFETE